MTFQIIWFILWGVLWSVYFMLDGFVLGAGTLHNVLAKTELEKRTLQRSFGPVWDGNEVWLLTAGGATFAAFPATYAAMFSYLYTALLFLLFALIVRGVAVELRNKEKDERWHNAWDKALIVSSFLPALLFGVAFGNFFRGLPIDAAGYQGSFFALLNPYGLLTGVLFVVLFLQHGALYVAVKTTGVVAERGAVLAGKLWPVVLVVAATFLVASNFATKLFVNYFNHPALFLVPLLAVGALVLVKVKLVQNNRLLAFAASCATILLVVTTGLVGLFPNLIPSNLDTAYSLTIYNSSSSPYTLKIMTVVAFIFVPIVIAYKIWVYRIFRAPVTPEEAVNDQLY
jgi:cytochrome d ubiquinol oxidase subunit II